MIISKDELGERFDYIVFGHFVVVRHLNETNNQLMFRSNKKTLDVPHVPTFKFVTCSRIFSLLNRF